MDKAKSDRGHLLRQLSIYEDIRETLARLRSKWSDGKRRELADELERLVHIDIETIEYCLEQDRRNGRSK